MNTENPLTISKLLVSFVVVTALTVIIANKTLFPTNAEATSILNDVKVEATKPVSGFSLVDHNENTITSNMFVGHWTFVFFGFTNCPDICPATLSQLVSLNKFIRSDSKLAGKFKTMFVSVDPERDSPKFLKEYVKYFDSNFIGATGEMNNIISFEKQFGAFHVIGEKRKENYTVSHTASVFLVNPDGMFSADFSPPMDLPMVVEQLNLFVNDFAKG